MSPRIPLPQRTLSLLFLLGFLFYVAIPVHATTYYVSKGGKDTNSGKSWVTAFATVQTAVSKAAASDQIWVAAGTYAITNTINLGSGVALYGGFAGNETSLTQRNFQANRTILDGQSASYNIVATPFLASVRTRVDGLIFQNAGGQYCDIYVQGNAIIQNDSIIENTKNISNGIYVNDNGNGVNSQIVNNSVIGGYRGIVIGNYVTCYVTGNTVMNTYREAIFARGSGGAIFLTGNIVSGAGTDGIACGSSCQQVVGNRITQSTGRGLYIYNCNILVLNNTISYNNDHGMVLTGNVIAKNNLVANNTTGTVGGGILADLSTGNCQITNNTLVDNSAGSPTAGGGIYLQNFTTKYSCNIANNLLAFNSSGVGTDGSSAKAGSLALAANDVFSSDYNNYDNITPGTTDFHLDPLFADYNNGNYHLTTPSPCIDTGTDTWVVTGDTDLDGGARIYGAHVDVGCYEWTPARYPELAGFAISPAVITSGATTSLLITLTSKALAPGATVQLVSSNPTAFPVQPTVTIGNPSSGGLFTVQTGAVTTPQAVVVTATYRGVSRSVTVTVNPLLATFAVTASGGAGTTTVIGGSTVVGTLTFSGPAPTAQTITITSSDPALTPSAPIAVAAGATGATFTASTSTVTQVKTLTVSATCGIQTITTPLTLNPGVTLKNLAITPGSVLAGAMATAVVTLTGPAPQGGVVIQIFIPKGQNAVSAPATVSIPAGRRSGTFLITTGATTFSGTVVAQFLVELGGIQKTANLTVAAPTLAALTLLPSTVQAGEDSIGVVTLTQPALWPVIVTLSNDQPTYASPDISTILIPVGATMGYFTISSMPGVAGTTSVTTTFKATFGTTIKTAVLTLTP